MTEPDPPTPFTEGLVGLLRNLGVSEEDIERAQDAGESGLVELFAQEAFLPGTERLTRREVEDRAGMDRDEARTFWRALGFPDQPDEARTFSEVDVEMLQRVRGLIDSGLVDRETALQNTRVMGRAMAQIAASILDTVRGRLGGDADAPPPLLLGTAPQLVDNLDHFLTYIWRRHFAAEVQRAASSFDANEFGTAIVGFADLVGFTGISRQLSAHDLAAAVSAFEATAVDLVGANGGRIVKMIGDEVMFETPTAKQGAVTALALIEAFEADARLPDVRAGLAAGPAIRNQGDLFGTAPNLASRLVDQAYPGTILVSDSIHDELAEEAGFEFRTVQPRDLKGFGPVTFWVLRRPGVESTREWKLEAKSRRPRPRKRA